MENIEIIIKQLSKKNKELAFKRLVDSYHKLIAAYIYRITKNYHETEDIVQEVFIKAYNEKRLFDDDFNIKAWLYRVSANTTFSILRKIKKIISHNIELDENIANYNDKNLEKIENSFDKALNKLKPKYKQILILRYFEDLDYKEIAEVLECKIGTVMSRLSRAKEQIAVLIEK